jgi:putative transposase
MRKVKLRMNEYHKYSIIKNLVDNGGNKNNAAIKLNLSRRQINRLIIKYKEKGKLNLKINIINQLMKIPI